MGRGKYVFEHRRPPSRGGRGEADMHVRYFQPAEASFGLFFLFLSFLFGSLAFNLEKGKTDVHQGERQQHRAHGRVGANVNKLLRK